MCALIVPFSFGLRESVDLALRFKCTKEQGAVLILKDDARKEAIHPNKTFVDYIRAHHESWYNFAQSVMELDIAREDIVLVRGWVKTSEWAVAAFTERGQSHEISFHGQLGHLAQAGLSLSMTESNMMSVETRSGPHRRPFAQLPEPRTSSTGKNVEVEPDNRRDQCVFLSYYKIKYRKFLPNKIAAAADPNSLPESDEAPTGSSSAEVISEPAPSKVCFLRLLWMKMSFSTVYPQLRSDPIDDVLSYILAVGGGI